MKCLRDRRRNRNIYYIIFAYDPKLSMIEFCGMNSPSLCLPLRQLRPAHLGETATLTRGALGAKVAQALSL